jgi:hypothetical protein
LDGICCPLPLTLCNYFINLLKVRKALRAWPRTFSREAFSLSRH